MEIREFFSSDNKDNWITQMKNCDWGAGQWLGELLETGKLQETVGEGALVPMVTDGDRLVSFCTFAPLDEVQPTELTPWVGFVYTFPEYRGHRYAGMVLDWCESVAAVMGKESIYISTDHIGLYEKYGYDFLQMMKNVGGEATRVYRKALQTEGAETEARKERGGRYKKDITDKAKQGLDMSAFCGFSCSHCFLGQWCGGCRSYFNCCSYGTLFEKGVCPNISCCREKGYDGCWDCDDLASCRKGFYGNGNDGYAAKAQAMFIKKYGKDAFFRMHDHLHKQYDFQKVQEIFGEDIENALKIMEENR